MKNIKEKTTLSIDRKLKRKAIKILNVPPKRSLSLFLEEKLAELIKKQTDKTKKFQLK